MKIITIVFSLIISSVAFAGYDSSRKTTCKKDGYKLIIEREGSFFGKDRITLKKDGSVIVDEKYEQDWSPEGDSEVEKRAKSELPCSNEGFYQLLKSKSTLVIESVTGGTWCESKGEKNSIYVQLAESKQIIKFVNETDCKKKIGL